MPVVIAGLILAFLVMLLFGGTELDRTLLFLFGIPEIAWIDQASAAIAWLAEPIPLLALTLAGCALLALRRAWLGLVLLLAVVLIGHLLVLLLQDLTLSLRPPTDQNLFPTQERSFPSRPAAGAALTTFSLAFLATRHTPARMWALFAAAAFTFLTGLSQLFLATNWPSGVIGGWALGLAWTLLLLKLARADLTDGTARPLRHFLPQGEYHEREPQDRDRPPE